MLNDKGFDLWSNGYDHSVNLSEEKNQYPFAGYKNVLNTVYQVIHKKEKAKILDLGFGTGVLTKKLYDEGYTIYGIDFSKGMIEIAQEKMPLAKLYQYDFSKGLPKELENEQFDYIITTYAIHHLQDDQKARFIKELNDNLLDQGKILIADVAFETRMLLEQCRQQAGDQWDTDEIYMVFEELKQGLSSKEEFIPISFCGGLLIVSKE